MGDVSTEDKNGEKTSSNTKLDDSNNELKPKETRPKEIEENTEDVPKVVCEKKPESPGREKSREASPEKETNLKSDVFCLEVIDDKAPEKERPEVETPRPPPTPRRVNKLRDHTSNIFPAGCMGCREDPPSDHVISPRRFFDPLKPKDLIGQIESTARKRPSSAKPNNACTRNPLTGVGLNDDEIKRSHGRRKDGNPLLGEGYETKQVTASSTRIPPGGYSQGLW